MKIEVWVPPNAYASAAAKPNNSGPIERPLIAGRLQATLGHTATNG